MLTKIDLCSMALLKIGEEPIASWTDDTASAKICRTLFDSIIDSLLTSHPWRFACHEYTIMANANGEFIVPADCLRVLQCPYEIIGNRIMSDATGTISILGITRVMPESFPSYFVSVAVAKLATEICVPLTGDQTMFRMLVSLYEAETRSAKFIDSTTADGNAIQNFSLIDARF